MPEVLQRTPLPANYQNQKDGKLSGGRFITVHTQSHSLTMVNFMVKSWMKNLKFIILLVHYEGNEVDLEMPRIEI